MTEPTYVVQAAAWALVWAGVGLTTRDLLARADTRRHRREHAAAAAHRRMAQPVGRHR